MVVEVNGLRIAMWPLGFFIVIILMTILWNRKHSLSYQLCFAVFAVYLFFAFDKVFFPIAINGTYADAMREVPFSSFINLIPFNFNLTEIPELVIGQILQNILLTVPFGFGVSFIVPLKPKHFLWLIPAVGLGIEATQILISLILQYPYHVIDINDSILNALGVLIGYIIFRIFAWLYTWLTRRLAIRLGGLPAYIDEVSRRA